MYGCPHLMRPKSEPNENETIKVFKYLLSSYPSTKAVTTDETRKRKRHESQQKKTE